VRVFLCDDVPDIRELVRYGLEQDPAIEVVGEAGDGQAGVDGVRDTEPDVIVLDLSMPTVDGLEAIPMLRACCPHTRILVLSGFTAAGMADRVLAAGAHAYVEKGTSLEELRREIHRLSRPDAAQRCA